MCSTAVRTCQYLNLWYAMRQFLWMSRALLCCRMARALFLASMPLAPDYTSHLFSDLNCEAQYTQPQKPLEA